MHCLEHAGALECVNHNLLVLAALAVEDELRYARLVGTDLNALVNVAVSVTSDGDRLLPVLHCRMDARDSDRCAEYGAVEDRADSAVRALPHLVQLVLVHALVVRCDGSTLNGYAQAFCSLGCVLCYLVAGLVALNESQVVILCLEVNERKDKLILDHLPQNTGHLVAIHLYEWSGHLNFFGHSYLDLRILSFEF